MRRAAALIGAATVLTSVSALGVGAPAAAAVRAPSCGPNAGEPMTSLPWPLQQLRPDLAWPISEGAGMTVAVIDSGVSATHPALAGKVREGRDFVQPSAKGQCDEVAHGTLVAGVIAGRTPENSVFSGIAPKASILPIRVLRDLSRDFNPNTSSDIATAIRWAADQDVDVINLSLTTDPTSTLESAIDYAIDRDVVVVAAAGNDGGSKGNEQTAYPAAYEDVIAVAGIDKEGHHVDTSTSGDYVDVAAPGAEVDGPMPRGDGYARFKDGGTSFAAAYVSGLAALLKSADPELTPAQIAQRIAATADHPPEGRNNQVGFGMINPYRALTAIAGNPKASPAPAALTPVTLPQDPMGNTRAIATWTAGGLAALALLIALVAGVVRGTRRRRGLTEPAGAAPVRSADPRRGAAAPARRTAANSGSADGQITAPKVRSRNATARSANPAAGAATATLGGRQQPLSWQPGAQRSPGQPPAGAPPSGRAQVPRR
ncbi:type VII secretion-associated serine protease mycosin [Asanoa sp. WMMD1127]|uniref:type VII secretion-associated serine protease mycosin n=1 Tax=Asanoa sp. WMMD1127 TaxID=3016107 RepID=UPI0024160AB7|nr:type VII secretion-associated serine protease mycosin [Asanoa sp. WMMD1127]MDG4821979.1 type VII secretion-associated serine protease mycosin [Asanoa sp. WMMD1127]